MTMKFDALFAALILIRFFGNCVELIAKQLLRVVEKVENELGQVVIGSLIVERRDDSYT